MNVILPSHLGNTVIMKKYMTMSEVEEYRRKVTGIFEAYGFSGAMVSFSYSDDASDCLPVKSHETGPSEGYESITEEPDPDKLPQYRKFDIMKFFKKS